MSSSAGKSIKHLDIHKNLTEEEINKIKNWYSYYHKLAT